MYVYYIYIYIYIYIYLYTLSCYIVLCYDRRRAPTQEADVRRTVAWVSPGRARPGDAMTLSRARQIVSLAESPAVVGHAVADGGDAFIDRRVQSLLYANAVNARDDELLDRLVDNGALAYQSPARKRAIIDEMTRRFLGMSSPHEWAQAAQDDSLMASLMGGFGPRSQAELDAQALAHVTGGVIHDDGVVQGLLGLPQDCDASVVQGLLGQPQDRDAGVVQGLLGLPPAQPQGDAAAVGRLMGQPPTPQGDAAVVGQLLGLPPQLPARTAQQGDVAAIGQ